MPIPSVPTFVLDTNNFRGASVDRLSAIRTRGLGIRVSDLALLETIARSVRTFHSGESRRVARGLLFARARSIANYVDTDTPVAPTGGQLVRSIISEVEGTAPLPEDVAYVTHLVDVWRRVSGVGMTDEEWLAAGAMAEEHVNSMDVDLRSLARPERELRNNPIPPDVTQGEYERSVAYYDSLTEPERHAALKHYLAGTLRFSDAVAERFDAYLSVATLRLGLAATEARSVTTNDGPDTEMVKHLAAGFMLLSDDRQLISLIDESRTYQRPWVRRLNDVDNLPDGPPWGESARKQAESYVRGPG